MAWSKSRQNSVFLWAVRTQNVVKNAKKFIMLKTHPDGPLSGFLDRLDHFWPILVRDETHFRTEGGFLLREFLGNDVFAGFEP